MIRIAICDDEAEPLHHAQALLKQYTMPVAIDIFTNGEALITASRQMLERGNPYHIIILDIDMQGLSGIDTAKQIRVFDKQVLLIYATNYSDYTTFAFGVHAFAYMIKPLTSSVLFQQLDEAIVYMKLIPSEPYTFQTTEGIIRIALEQVQYFEYINGLESISRGVVLYANGRRYFIKQRISDIAEALKEKGFEMPHKSFVVNLCAVKAIHGYDIHLSQGAIIPLSQKKALVFRQSLNRFLASGGGLI